MREGPLFSAQRYGNMNLTERQTDHFRPITRDSNHVAGCFVSFQKRDSTCKHMLRQRSKRDNVPVGTGHCVQAVV